MCVDFLAEKHGFKINKLKFKAVIADTVINSHRCIVMKPQTYMTVSYTHLDVYKRQSYDNAYKTLNYENDKAILKKAKAYLTEHSI